MNLISQKCVLLCVSGGIAVYKSLELVRFLKKQGALVRVVMSAEAQRFVSALSFEALSGEKVLCEGAEDWSAKGANHISYASWAEVCILAPATMNSLSKFAYGIADNIMLSTLLACQCPICIAPSANTNMYLSPQAQKAIKLLQEMGHFILEPKEGLLACGVYGVGAMCEPQEIGFFAMRLLLENSFWKGKKVVISGGGSFEGIDEVRCITNYSSGIQASSMALALYFLGAEVCFVTSQMPMPLPQGIKIYRVKSTQEFAKHINEELQEGGYYFGIAALSDFIPKQMQKGKIKKEQGLEVEFVPNLDILKSLELANVIKIGFKAEKDETQALENAKRMLESKKCDYVCLNLLGESNDFGSSLNRVTLLSQSEIKEFALQDKLELSYQIALYLAQQ